MNKAKLMLLTGVVAATTLPGCVDNDYDLSDIDTTVQMQVKDLTLPINIDPIQLKSILDPSENSIIKDLGGEYAMIQNGKITSDEIKIERQKVTAPEIKPTVRELHETTGTGASIPGTDITATYSYIISDVTGDFSYDKADIPSEILAINQIGADWTISIDVNVSQTEMSLESMELKDLVLSLPKGLSTDADNYDATTGDLVLGTVKLPAGTDRYRMDIKVHKVDLTKWDKKDYTFTPATGSGKGKIHLSGHVGLKSGIAKLTVSGGHASSVTMKLTPVLSEIDIKSFSGRVQYTFSNMNIPDIDISDLPDLLADPETSLLLTNPQLYIKVNNPVANYGLDASTGLEMTPMRNGVARNTCSLNPGQTILIGHSKGVTGPYTFCISPEKPEKYYEGFESATQVYCTDLAKILSGDGIPTSISVNLPNAGTVPGDVTDFILGESMGKVDGEYTVYCPLNLGKDTHIVYSSTEDGWNDETVDRISIKELELTTTITNTLPFDVVLSGYPLSVNPSGTEPQQSIDPATNKPVTIKEIKVGARQTVSITTNTDGTVEHLDGIHFVARAVINNDNTTVLAPEDCITLNDIRVTVSGYYTDEL